MTERSEGAGARCPGLFNRFLRRVQRRQIIFCTPYSCISIASVRRPRYPVLENSPKKLYPITVKLILPRAIAPAVLRWRRPWPRKVGTGNCTGRRRRWRCWRRGAAGWRRAAAAGPAHPRGEEENALPRQHLEE